MYQNDNKSVRVRNKTRISINERVRLYLMKAHVRRRQRQEMGESKGIFIMMADEAMWYSHNDVLNGPIRQFAASGRIDTDSRANLRNARINDKDQIEYALASSTTSKNDGKTKISAALDRNIKRGRSRSNDRTICVKLVKLKNNRDGEKMKMTILKSNSLHNYYKRVFGRHRSP